MRRAHSMPFAQRHGRRAFRPLAPTARDVAILVDEREHPMPEEKGGWRHPCCPSARRQPLPIPHRRCPPCRTPARACQPDDISGPSLVSIQLPIDGATANGAGVRGKGAFLYEAHVEQRPRRAPMPRSATAGELRDLGVTAVELMPLSDFPGRRNWGYDGVLPFGARGRPTARPNDSRRSSTVPIRLGVMVFPRLVTTIFGPAGNYLHATPRPSSTDRHQTPWRAASISMGRRPDGARLLRPQRALLLEEFHLDGLRFDARARHPRRQPTHIIAEMVRARARRPCPAATCISS